MVKVLGIVLAGMSPPMPKDLIRGCGEGSGARCGLEAKAKFPLGADKLLHRSRGLSWDARQPQANGQNDE